MLANGNFSNVSLEQSPPPAFTLAAGQTYVTDARLAQHFGVHRATVWRWARDKSNAFPEPVKFSAKFHRWRVADIQAFEAAAA